MSFLLYEFFTMFNIENKKKRKIKKLKNIFVVLFLMANSFFAGMYFVQKNETIDELAKEEVIYVGKVLNKYSESAEGELIQDVNFNLFWDLWDILKDKYVDPEEINEKKMFYGAMRGLAASLKDPYTVFMEPKSAKEFQDDLDNDEKFEGIGAELGMKNDILTVVAPLEGMPAQIAGLKSGDKIIAINGETTANINVYEAVKIIRGPKDTDVKLTIVRNGLNKAKDITITRGTIVVKSLRTNLRDDNIFVIKLINFNENTKVLMDQATRKVLDINPIGIILDMRNNPGGYLDIAVEIASEWVEDGVIVSEEFNNDLKNHRLATGRAKLSDFKTIVLVNQGSASASEIVAGALQDHKKATIIGKKSYGKGSVQALEKLQDGSSVKVTVAKWLTPNGVNINKEGITPDYTIEVSAEQFDKGEDPQIEGAAYFMINNTFEGTDYLSTSTDEIATSTLETTTSTVPTSTVNILEDVDL